MSLKDHWNQAYSTKPSEKLGWYEPHLQTSLGLINELGLPKHAPLIDVGGGASTLADDLLKAGYRSITVLDIADEALTLVQARLGKRAELVTWLNDDITSVDLPTHHYVLWHDRAVLHFLTEVEPQRKYREKLLRALKPCGHLIIGTFAPEAPPKCSGLPVRRYTPEKLVNMLGRDFALMRHHKEPHRTPSGLEQMYLYCHLQRTA